MVKKYSGLNMHRAMAHPYSADKISHIAHALGVDASDSDAMGEYFKRNGSTTYLTSKGVEALAAKQDKWQKAKLYNGGVDGVWGGLSEEAYKKSGGPNGILPVIEASTTKRAEPKVVADGIIPAVEAGGTRKREVSDILPTVEGRTNKGPTPV